MRRPESPNRPTPRLIWQARTYSMTIVLVCGLTGVLVLIRVFAAGDRAGVRAYSMTAVSSLLILALNELLRAVVLVMSAREGHTTVTAHERSRFSKLALAYVLNTAVLPFVTGLFVSGVVSGGTRVIDQAWFEESGVIVTPTASLNPRRQCHVPHRHAGGASAARTPPLLVAVPGGRDDVCANRRR